MSKSVYGTSPLKQKRCRRTKAALESLDEYLTELVGKLHPITVRGTFYRAEVAGRVPKDETGYDVVQRRLIKLRREGRIPWHQITDSTRLVRRLSRWNGVADFASHAASFYRRDYWANASVNVEIWIEKDALAGVVFPTVVEQWGLELFVARGFSSTTYLQNAGQAIKEDGRSTYVYILGDFDPSGLCAVETISRELPEFAGGVEVHVNHLAVDHETIRAYNLPTRKLKRKDDGKFSDSRAPKYVERFDDMACELDAMSPDDLRSLISDAIARHADLGTIAHLKEIEGQERELFARLDINALARRGGRP